MRRFGALRRAAANVSVVGCMHERSISVSGFLQQQRKKEKKRETRYAWLNMEMRNWHDVTTAFFFKILFSFSLVPAVEADDSFVLCAD